MSASIKESKQLEAKSLKFKIICSEISKILYIYRKFAYFLKITVRLLNHPELLYVYCIKPKILYINYSVGTLNEPQVRLALEFTMNIVLAGQRLSLFWSNKCIFHLKDVLTQK